MIIIRISLFTVIVPLFFYSCTDYKEYELGTHHYMSFVINGKQYSSNYDSHFWGRDYNSYVGVSLGRWRNDYSLSYMMDIAQNKVEINDSDTLYIGGLMNEGLVVFFLIPYKDITLNHKHVVDLEKTYWFDGALIPEKKKQVSSGYIVFEENQLLSSEHYIKGSFHLEIMENSSFLTTSFEYFNLSLNSCASNLFHYQGNYE